MSEELFVNEDLTFEFVIAEAGHYGTVMWRYWPPSSTHDGWDHLSGATPDGAIDINGLIGSAWYPGSQPPYKAHESGQFDYVNDLGYMQIGRSRENEGTYSNWYAWMAVLWFDTTWIATTMFHATATLTLDLDLYAINDSFQLYGTWYSDLFMGDAPYGVDWTNWDRDPLGVAAFEPIPVSELGQGQNVITLDDSEDHVEYGAYTGIRLWLGAQTPDGVNEIRINTQYNGSSDPMLTLGLSCTDPDATGEEPEEPEFPELPELEWWEEQWLEDVTYDNLLGSHRYSDRPPSRYLDALRIRAGRRTSIVSGTLRRRPSDGTDAGET